MTEDIIISAPLPASQTQDGNSNQVIFESPIPVQNLNPRQGTTFKTMPNKGAGPVANYYAEINWEGGYQQWPLVRFSTPMDGSCLFHSIANSFFAPYHNETLRGKAVSKDKMIEALRKELAQKLAARISDDPNSLTHYDSLNGGNTSAFAEAVPEFGLRYMQSQLDSRTSIGYGYMEFIGNALNKDIYILEAMRRDIYVTDELPLTIKGNRSSIVLYYMNGHYELVGIQNNDGTFVTHFTPDHSFIQFLRDRVSQIIRSRY
jgi:hypothetical protein